MLFLQLQSPILHRVNLPQIDVYETCPFLPQVASSTACAGAEQVAALSAAAACRSQMARAGALHALVPAALQYDYTLTESGLDTDAESNKQV